MISLLKNSIQLADSIIFKSKLFAIGDLKSLMDTGKYRGEFKNPRDWYYYKNMCGEHSYINNELKSRDGVVVSKTTLTTNKRLKASYYYGSELFKDLLFLYPEDTSLIYGLLNVPNLTMDELLKKRDGEIVHYSKELVEWNEGSLMFKIQESLYEFMQRYTNQEFLFIDRDYYQGLGLAIQTFLINKIIEIRLSLQNTNEAHSYFQVAKLNSSLYIGSQVEYLNKEQLLWLYRNIDDISYNVGKDSNLKYITEKLIKPSGYKLDRVIVENIRMVEEIKDGKAIGKQDHNPLGLSNILKEDELNSITLERIYNMITKTSKRLDIDNFLSDMKSIKLTPFKENTKYLYLSKISSGVPNILHDSEIIVPLTIRMLINTKEKKYNLRIGSGVYSLLGEDILTIYLYSIYMLNGRDTKVISKISNNTIIDIDNVSNEMLLTNIDFLNVNDKDIMSEILNSVRINTLTFNPFEIKEYINNQQYLRLYIEIMKSSMNNVIHKGMWDVVISRITNTPTINIEEMDLVTQINKVSVDIEDINTKDKWFTVLKDITMLVTSQDLLKEEEDKRILNLQSNLINRLTSYSTNIIYNEPIETYNTKYDDIGGVYDTTIIDIHKLKYDCLGAVVTVQSVYGSDEQLGLYISPTPSITAKVSSNVLDINVNVSKGNTMYIEPDLPVTVRVT